MSDSKKKPKRDTVWLHSGSQLWAKKHQGQVYYFERVTDDPDGEKSLEAWAELKDDLKHGRERREKPTALTIADLCEQYCVHQEKRRDAGEIAPRTHQGMVSSCAIIVGVFGKNREVAGLTRDDFARLKSSLAKCKKKDGTISDRMPNSMRNEMQRVRSVFRYAVKNKLIKEEADYGDSFNRPPLKQVRRSRRLNKERHGGRSFEAAEIRLILEACSPSMNALVLLAINCGFGQSDLSSLPISAIDFEAGVVEFPRPKTEADRRCTLWAETIQAIKEYLPLRPKPARREDDKLLFITRFGRRYVNVNKLGVASDGLGQEFTKLLKRLGLKRPGLSFYALRRSFRTTAGNLSDRDGINVIMGHVNAEMSDHYIESIDDSRLQVITDYVRSWLFGDTTDDDTDDFTPTLKIADGVDETSDNRDKPDSPVLRVFAG